MRTVPKESYMGPNVTLGSIELRKKWLETGLSMRVFAEKRLGVHRTTCLRWCNGWHSPDRTNSLMIQKRLGIPAGWWNKKVMING